MATTKPIITLITGADKGIGLATAQGLAEKGQHVLIGARDPKKGAAAVAKLKDKDHAIQAETIQLDVTDEASIKAAAATIDQKFGYLSVLVNNAGVALDAHKPASEIPMALIRQDFEVNFFGLVAVTQAMVPLLRKADHARIVNVTSNMGSLGLATDPNSRFFKVNSMGYQASKAAANFATISFSKELAAEGIPVNSVNPGWTATSFGGRDPASAPIPGMQDVATGAAHVIAVASATDDVTGTFTENAGTLPW